MEKVKIRQVNVSRRLPAGALLKAGAPDRQLELVKNCVDKALRRDPRITSDALKTALAGDPGIASVRAVPPPDQWFWVFDPGLGRWVQVCIHGQTLLVEPRGNDFPGTPVMVEAWEEMAAAAGQPG